MHSFIQLDFLFYSYFSKTMLYSCGGAAGELASTSAAVLCRILNRSPFRSRKKDQQREKRYMEFVFLLPTVTFFDWSNFAISRKVSANPNAKSLLTINNINNLIVTRLFESIVVHCASSFRSSHPLNNR